VDHRDQAGTLGDQPWRGLQGDAADGGDRLAEARPGLLQQFDVGGRCAGLGIRVVEAAEGDVAGTLGDRLLGQRQLRVAGGADDRLAAEQGARGGQRTVLLAQVQADAQACGQFGIVVDDQLRAVVCAEFQQGIGLAQATGIVAGLVAVLQQAGATLERGFDVGQQAPFGQQLAVGDRVEAAEPGGFLHAQLSGQARSSGRRRGMYWPWPGASASRRVRQV